MLHFIIIGLVTALSLTLGVIYASHNVDVHHWGFILATSIDFINSKHLFSEIFVQYGVGQPFLFKFLSSFFPITYTSIGVVTSIFYVSNLLVLYLTLRNLVSSKKAIYIFLLLFGLHPFNISPWPDYFAGFFLSLSAYFILKKETNLYHSLAAGVMLFIAFLFRSTYGLAVLLGSVAYLMCMFIRPSIKDKNVFITIATFLTGLGLFFIFLLSNQVFELWFNQAFRIASSGYGVGLSSIFKLVKNILFPFDFSYAFLTLFLLINCYFLFQFLFKKIELQASNVFLIFVGLAGLLQSLMIYEVFRLINACSPIILVGCYLLRERMTGNMFKASALWLLFIFLFKFPYTSAYFAPYQGRLREYVPTNIAIFGKHYMKEREIAYYDGLQTALCDKKTTIVNETKDSMIHLLCPDQKNEFIVPFFSKKILAKIQPDQFQSLADRNFNNEVFLVTDKAVVEKNFKAEIIKTVLRPDSIPYMNDDTLVPVNIYRITPL